MFLTARHFQPSLIFEDNDKKLFITFQASPLCILKCLSRLKCSALKNTSLFCLSITDAKALYISYKICYKMHRFMENQFFEKPSIEDSWIILQALFQKEVDLLPFKL